jgi:hypothetical protein
VFLRVVQPAALRERVEHDLVGMQVEGRDLHPLVEPPLQLANKGDDLSKVADEWLAVCCVLGPILTGRDCLVLTADADVADHVFELHTLIHEQYGSLLIAEDLRRNPWRYPHFHPAEVGFMKPGAVAYGRDVDPDYLRPSVALTCASWVINVTDLSSLVAIATRDAVRTISRRTSPARSGSPMAGTVAPSTGRRGQRAAVEAARCTSSSAKTRSFETSSRSSAASASRP